MQIKIVTPLLLFAACIFFTQICQAQLSVFGFEGFDDFVGWSAGSSNKNCERDKKAEEDYHRKGGKQIRLGRFPGQKICLNEEYGCYALIRGINAEKKAIYAYANGKKSVEEAITEAKYSAINSASGIIENTISIITSGCLKAPQSSSQQVKSQPQWSDLIKDECFPDLKYKYQGKDVYDLNHQYHYYFEATNNYKETIYFDFNLLDKDGKVRFGNRRSISPGKTIQFNHKMTDNYIVSFKMEKVCFRLDDGKYQSCEGESKSENKPSSSFEADIKRLADYYCKMRVNEVTSNPNDKKAREEYWKIAKEEDNFRTILEEKYSMKVLRSEAAKKITLEEWKKCPVKVIIN